MKILLKKKKNDQFQFIGGMKVGEPSADGRGSAPPELAKQQAQAGSDAAPATPPPLGAQSTFIPLHRWGGGVKVLLRYFITRK